MADPAGLLYGYQPEKVYPMVPVASALATVLAEASLLQRTERVPVSACLSRVLAKVGRTE